MVVIAVRVAMIESVKLREPCVNMKKILYYYGQLGDSIEIVVQFDASFQVVVVEIVNLEMIIVLNLKLAVLLSIPPLLLEDVSQPQQFYLPSMWCILQ